VRQLLVILLTVDNLHYKTLLTFTLLSVWCRFHRLAAAEAEKNKEGEKEVLEGTPSGK